MSRAGRAAVLGSPIEHSLSPVLHRAAYDALGLPGWRYDAYDVATPALAGFLAGLDDSWAGLSLTMPLKSTVLGLLDEASPLVRAVRGANTVLLYDGVRRGENTDVPGMVAALREAGVVAEAGGVSVDHSVVLGGGATARSAVAALAGVARSVTVYLRSTHRAEQVRATARDVGVAVDVASWADAAAGLGADLVVNTTPAGAADVLARHVDSARRRTGTLFEVLYDPWPTPLAAAWEARGGRVVGGLELLVQQAALQVALMTRAGAVVPALVPVLRAAGERALRTR